MNCGLDVDIERILTLLRDARDYMSLYSHLPVDDPEGMAHLLASERDMFEPSMFDAINRQLECEKRWMNKYMNHEPTQPVKIKDKRTLEDFTAELQESIKDFCRLYRSNQGTCNSRSLATQKQQLESVFNGNISAGVYRMKHVWDDLIQVVECSLETSVEEEEESREKVRESSLRIQVEEDRCKKLRIQVNNERQARHESMGFYQSLVSKLQVEVNDTRNIADGQLMLIGQETKEAGLNSLSSFESSQLGSSEQRRHLENVLKRNREEYRKEEENRRARMKKAQLELKSIIDSYDCDLIEYQRKIESLHKSMEDEQIQLQELTEYFEKIEVDRNNEEEEMIEVEKKLEVERNFEMKRFESCVLIQSWIRGFLARKEYAKLKKLKRKKRKGKGKKIRK